jgi:hypothetical protein
VAESPVARGLLLCERVIIEERTRNISLINCFNRRLVDAFPSPPQQFTVYAVLANGHGTIQVDFRVTSLADDTVVYQRPVPVSFADPLTEARFVFRIGALVFPSSGSYEFSLLVDGEPIAGTRLDIVRAGGTS